MHYATWKCQNKDCKCSTTSETSITDLINNINLKMCDGAFESKIEWVLIDRLSREDSLEIYGVFSRCENMESAYRDGMMYPKY